MIEHTDDVRYLKNTYRKARNKYKPDTITTLIVAEAPPCAIDRDFYFEEVKVQDSLFLEIMGVLYPADKEKYMKSGRNPDLKEALLNNFKEEGYWMMEVSEVPTSVDTSPFDSFLPSFMARMEQEISKQTPIILIKSNVYDVCYPALKAAGYNVVDERMPFPGSGQQRVFREKFAKALNR